MVRSSPLVQGRLGALLRDGDCGAITPRSFSSIVSRVGTRRPRLVVLSVGLPKADNFSLYARVHAFSRIPVVFIADYGASVSRLGDVVLNKSTFVAGPCGATVLLTGVTSLLGGICPARRERRVICKSTILRLRSDDLSCRKRDMRLAGGRLGVLCCLFGGKKGVYSHKSVVRCL